MVNDQTAGPGFDPFTKSAAPENSATKSRSEARLLVTNIGRVTEVSLSAPHELVRAVAAAWFEGVEPEPKILFKLDYEFGKISLFPQTIYFSNHLYQQKYRRIKEIQLDFNIEASPPQNHDEALDALNDLPSGFIKDPGYGLGLIKEMRPLIHSIECIKGVTRLLIGEFETTHVNGCNFCLPEAEYSILRSGMNRIARRYQSESLIDREIMAHNASIHKARPEEFKFKERPYEPGTIYKLLGGSQSGTTKLRGKDRRGILDSLAANAVAIAKRDPKEFIQLQKDIELVSLDQLIASCQVKLRRNGQESEWQKLLELNPFILSMLFGQPVIVLQAGASVGGQTISGGGMKIADFLAKNSLTNNAALVELKTPKTQLLGAKYRTGVYAPSPALMGAIAQVLDQRLKIVTDIAGIKHRSKIVNLEVYAVECVVVVGQTPDDENERASFEMIRNQMKDVRVITFDELIERLQLLRELLSGERYLSDLDDEEEDEFGELPVNDSFEVSTDVEDPWNDDEVPF
jgi:hypothetical protein